MIKFEEHPTCPKCWHLHCDILFWIPWMDNTDSKEVLQVTCQRCKYAFRMHCADHRESTNAHYGEGVNGL